MKFTLINLSSSKEKRFDVFFNAIQKSSTIFASKGGRILRLGQWYQTVPSLF